MWRNKLHGGSSIATKMFQAITNAVNRNDAWNKRKDEGSIINLLSGNLHQRNPEVNGAEQKKRRVGIKDATIKKLNVRFLSN